LFKATFVPPFAVVDEYLPAAQSRHVVATDAPTVVEYLPAAQSRHTVDEVAPTVVEYLPAAQSRHVVATDAPTVVEYLPASQATHAVSAAAPVLVRYLPAAQSRHTVDEVAPTVVEYFPAAQSRHIEAFAVAENFPAAHAAQVSLCVTKSGLVVQEYMIFLQTALSSIATVQPDRHPVPAFRCQDSRCAQVPVVCSLASALPNDTLLVGANPTELEPASEL